MTEDCSSNLLLDRTAVPASAFNASKWVTGHTPDQARLGIRHWLNGSTGLESWSTGSSATENYQNWISVSDISIDMFS